jgi:serine/threonine-protein kinase
VPVEADLLPERYRGPRPVGHGGMGDVYRATDDVLGRAVAIKVLSERYASDESVRARFVREALAAARLSGERNIVTIFDVGESRGRPFIVMEYLSGGSLEEVLRDSGAQPVGRVLDWLEQAARALDAAHRAGVVHRDVKPGNLLLDRDGNVHVADFGIASAAGLDSLTQTGTILGTAGYLSPEQAQGERATAASDRYALGVVAYELLTGRRPFAAETTAAEAAAHAFAPVPSLCAAGADLPCAELDPIFRRAMAKEAGPRFETCGEFVAALRQAVEQAAGRTAAIRPVRQQRRRSRRWPLVAFALLAALVGGIVGAVLAGRGGQTEAQQSVLTRTVTQPGTTATITTAPPPAPPPPAPPPPSPPASNVGPHALNDRGFDLMRRGAYVAALPLLEQAVQGLRGAGPSDPYEAFANYNLGYTLLQLGRCDEAVQFLETAKHLEPQRHEPKDALKQARRC